MVWASSFLFYCFHILSSFVTGACRGSVLFIVQTGLPNLLFTAGYMLTQWCANAIAYGPLGWRQRVWSSQHPCGQHTASLWPEGRSWCWLMNLARPFWRGCFASLCPLIWWLPAGSRVQWVRQSLSQWFDSSGLNASLRVWSLVSTDAIALCCVNQW